MCLMVVSLDKCSVVYNIISHLSHQPDFKTEIHFNTFRYFHFAACLKLQDATDSTEIMISRDQSEYGLNQWETTLQCNVVFHWLSPCN